MDSFDTARGRLGVGSLPWIKWYPSKWLSSETRKDMNAVERCVYRDLLDYCYEKGSIPCERDLLVKLVDLSGAEFDAAWTRVQRCFDPHPTIPNRLINKRVEEQIATRYDGTERSRKCREKKRLAKIATGATLAQHEVQRCVATKRNADPQREDKEIDKDKEESNVATGVPLDEFFESRYRRHPKKADRTLAESAMCSIPGIQSIGVQAQFATSHEAWIATEDYRKDGGRWAPKFAIFINDRTWMYDPPTKAQGAVDDGKWPDYVPDP